MHLRQIESVEFIYDRTNVSFHPSYVGEDANFSGVMVVIAARGYETCTTIELLLPRASQKPTKPAQFSKQLSRGVDAFELHRNRVDRRLERGSFERRPVLNKTGSPTEGQFVYDRISQN